MEKNIPNINYYQQLLNNSNLSQSTNIYLQKIIDSVKRQDGNCSERQYNVLQQLKNGYTNYSSKNEIKIKPSLPYLKFKDEQAFFEFYKKINLPYNDDLENFDNPEDIVDNSDFDTRNHYTTSWRLYQEQPRLFKDDNVGEDIFATISTFLFDDIEAEYEDWEMEYIDKDEFNIIKNFVSNEEGLFEIKRMQTLANIKNESKR